MTQLPLLAIDLGFLVSGDDEAGWKYGWERQNAVFSAALHHEEA